MTYICTAADRAFQHKVWIIWRGRLTTRWISDIRLSLQSKSAHQWC